MSRVFTGCMWLAAAVGLTFMTLPVLAIFLRVPPAELVRRLGDPAVRDALVVTAKTTLIAQAFILALGTPLAFVLATHSFRGRSLVVSLVELPLVLPPAVAGLGLFATFGRLGLLGSTLDTLGLHIALTQAAVLLAVAFVAGPLDLTSRRRLFDLALSLEVGAGETVALVGPSGAGKSTVLRAVAGLTRITGTVRLGGERWLDSAAGIDLPPERRSVGLVFQEYALFPHMSVADNVEFGGRERTAELLERLNIRHLVGERPAELSGGERQRVALARALARAPRVTLLDAPLPALDSRTRAAVRGELHQFLRETGLPT